MQRQWEWEAIVNILLAALLMAFWLIAVGPNTAHAAGPQSTEGTTAAATEARSALSGREQAANIAAEAARWGLTELEYVRSLEIMRGLRGRISDPGITPIEVLGIEAATPAERAKYAEMWVRMIEADTRKVLAFSTAVHAAWQRLYPAANFIDRGRVNQIRAQTDSRFGPMPIDLTRVKFPGRMMLFTRLACTTCDDALAGLVEKVDADELRGLDIYVLDATDGDHAQIQDWARDRQIPIGLVRSGRVTLNFNAGTFEALADSLQYTPGRMPVLVHRLGDTYEMVSFRND